MGQNQALLNDWHIVADARELQPLTVLPKRLLSEDIVLWHNGSTIFAWQDFCPHRGARLSLGRIEKGNLACAYHGLQFNTEGKCVLLPATPDQPPPNRGFIKTYHVQEKYGIIWVCMGTPKRDIPHFPQWEDSASRKILSGPYRIQASPFRVLENFIDPAHFPFAHHGTFATSNHPEIIFDELKASSSGICLDFKFWFKDFLVENNEDVVVTLLPCRYEIFHPLVVYFQNGIGTNDYLSIYCAITPIDENESQLWLLFGVMFGEDVTDASFLEFQAAISKQDTRIIESQRPQHFSLDSQKEIHLPSDRLSLAYRKWLFEQGILNSKVQYRT
ncbi:MAG: aromatic ring-hydroxylating dioxygenase subunit alpha [Nostoc sp. ChiQUE01b]|nr:aromatic ring-hydroxylating dioxygenase subunit alpha [Nostoc sp. ChiQUE01b]